MAKHMLTRSAGKMASPTKVLKLGLLLVVRMTVKAHSQDVHFFKSKKRRNYACLFAVQGNEMRTLPANKCDPCHPPPLHTHTHSVCLFYIENHLMLFLLYKVMLTINTCRRVEQSHQLHAGTIPTQGGRCLELLFLCCLFIRIVFLT